MKLSVPALPEGTKTGRAHVQGDGPSRSRHGFILISGVDNFAGGRLGVWV